MPVAREATGGRDTTVIAEGLCFPESPRWREGRLWFSDQHARRVLSLEGGVPTEVVAVPAQPSGLGWTPEGNLLIVSMVDRRLLRLEDDGLVEVADLSHVAPWHCNDMLVDDAGRAYIGNFGFDEVADPVTSTVLCLVEQDGTVEVAAEDLVFPNGMALNDEGRTLVVAETYAQRLSAFDVRPDGRLGARRTLAQFTDEHPDGVCADAGGAVWTASPTTREVLRVLPDGTVGDRLSTAPNRAFACALGGNDGHTLFICTAPTSDQNQTVAVRGGRIEATWVPTPAPS